MEKNEFNFLQIKKLNLKNTAVKKITKVFNYLQNQNQSF